MISQRGPLIGQGRTAEVFEWGDTQVLKLFKRGYPSESVEREANISRIVHERGLPVPAVGDTVEIDDRLGVEFERIDGPSMLRQLSSKPWRVKSMARTLAEIHATIHERDGSSLPSQKEYLERSIRAAPRLTDEARAAALETLERLPEGNAVCHGDFHPENILLSPNGPIVIDWIIATSGNPIADVARTSMILRLGSIPSGSPGKLLITIARRMFHGHYMKQYTALTGVTLEQVREWELPIVAARLNEGIEDEESDLLTVIHYTLEARSQNLS